MVVDKDTKKIIKAARRQGFTVTVNRRGHPMFSIDGRTVAVSSGTASDWRGQQNLIARLRRSGLRWPAP